MRTQHNDPDATSVGLENLGPPDDWVDRTQLGADQDAENEDAEDEEDAGIDEIPWDEDEQQPLLGDVAQPAHRGGFDPQPNTPLFIPQFQALLNLHPALRTAEQQAWVDAVCIPTPDTFTDPNLSTEDPDHCWECLFMPESELCDLHTPSY